MTDLKRCCRPRHDHRRRCFELIEAGIQAQCEGLEHLRRDGSCGREQIRRGIRQVEEGLCCLERR